MARTGGVDFWHWGVRKVDVAVLDTRKSVLLVPLRLLDTPSQDKTGGWTHNPRPAMHEPARNRNAPVPDARDVVLRNVAFGPLVVVVVHVVEEPQLESETGCEIWLAT